MKKLTLNAIALTIVGSMVVGCSSTPEKPKTIRDMVQTDGVCYFPKTQAKAPEWVCSDLSEMDGMYVVGIAEPTKAGISHQRKMAMLDAKTQLASKLKTTISSMVKSYVETTGRNNTETVDAVSSSVSKEIVHQKLQGVSRKAATYDPEGRLYLLAGINKENTAKMLKTAIKSSFNKDSAEWQKLQADKAFKELNQEVEAKYGEHEQ